MSEQNKKLLYVALGGAALVGAALVFALFSGKSESSSSICFEEIDALGPPKKESNGMFAFSYYKDVFLIISKHAKLKFADEKKELVAKRRKLLKEGNMIEYRGIVEQLI